MAHNLTQDQKLRLKLMVETIYSYVTFFVAFEIC